MKKVILLVLIIALSACLVYSESMDSKMQILSGQVSAFRSLESFVKGIYEYEGLTGENADVSGELYYCEWGFLAQYPEKSAVYLNYYVKTGIPEYKLLSEQIISKLYKVYSSTKDKDKKNWIPTMQLISDDGKYYGYSKGRRFSRNSGSNPFSFDQSKCKYFIKNAGFPDAFGLGLFELSKNAKYLSEDSRKQLIEIINGMLDFWHREYMIVWKSGKMYYRTEDVEPLTAQKQKGDISWGCLASDVVYSLKALFEMGENTDRFEQRVGNFVKSYIDGRLLHRNAARIEYLDDRMLELADYYYKKGINKDLADKIYSTLKYAYAKTDKKAVFMYGGSLTNHSTIPFLSIFSKLKDKESFKTLWDDIWENNFSEKTGILIPSTTTGINGSAYHALLGYGCSAWKNGTISDEEFNAALRKYYMFKGNPENYRDLDDWVMETGRLLDGKEPYWLAAPYDSYPEKVESEASYGKRNSPQGMTIDRFYRGVNPDSRTNRNRNTYYQFTAPAENHAEKIFYAQTMTFNIIETGENSIIDLPSDLSKEEFSIQKTFTYADAPKDAYCLGIFDVTDYYYKDKQIPVVNGYEVSKVEIEKESRAFELSHMLDYERPRSGKHRARLCVLIPNKKNGDKGEVTISFRKSKGAYYLENEYSPELKSPVDLPFVRISQQDTTFEYAYEDAVKYFENYMKRRKISDEELVLNNWEKLYIIYSFEKEKKTEKKHNEALKELLSSIKSYIAKVDETNIANTAERVKVLSRIYMLLKEDNPGETPDQLGIRERLQKDAGILLNARTEETKNEALVVSEALIRYGVLFGTYENGKESLTAGLILLSKILDKRINAEGMDANKETVNVLRSTLRTVRLLRLNKVDVERKIPGKLEQMGEFLMYMSEPDGTVSDLADIVNTENIREEFYWLGKIFKRKDFRYIAFAGLNMENSVPPAETSKAFPESKLAVLRNSWNIRDRNLYGKLEDERIFGKRSYCLFFDLRDSRMEVSALGRKLIKSEKIPALELTLVESAFNDKLDYIKLAGKEEGKYVEIINVKSEFLFVNIADKKQIKLDFVCSRMDSDIFNVKTINPSRPIFSWEKQAYPLEEGEIWLMPVLGMPIPDIKNKQYSIFGDNISFVIYPYCHEKGKAKEERVDKSYKPLPGEDKIQVFGKEGVYFKKRLPYAPTIKSEILENGIKFKAEEEKREYSVGLNGKLENFESDGKILIENKDLNYGKTEYIVYQGSKIKEKGVLLENNEKNSIIPVVK
ncbi:MAG: hypothetical protein V1752_07165 [Candidatus Firestonebacteria bacterium]